MTGVGTGESCARELVGHFKGDTPHKYGFNALLFGGISKEALFYFHTLHNSGSPVPRSERSLALSPEALCKATESCLPLPAGLFHAQVRALMWLLARKINQVNSFLVKQ